MRSINITYRNAKTLAHIGQRFEVYAFYVGVKMLFGSSAFYPTKSNVARLFSVNKEKASLLIQSAIADTQLFDYKSSGLLIARSLHRDFEVSTNSYKGKQYIAKQAYCMKMQFAECKTLKLQDVKKSLREALFLCAVEAMDRENEYKDAEPKTHGVYYSSRSERAKALDYTKIARIIGLSVASAFRLVKGLCERGVISKTRHNLIQHSDMEGRAIDANVQSRVPFVVPQMSVRCVRDANTYHIVKNTTWKFGNVILNHAQRIKGQPTTTLCDAGIDYLDNFYASSANLGSFSMADEYGVSFVR